MTYDCSITVPTVELTPTNCPVNECTTTLHKHSSNEVFHTALNLFPPFIPLAHDQSSGSQYRIKDPEDAPSLETASLQECAKWPGKVVCPCALRFQHVRRLRQESQIHSRSGLHTELLARPVNPDFTDPVSVSPLQEMSKGIPVALKDSVKRFVSAGKPIKIHYLKTHF